MPNIITAGDTSNGIVLTRDTDGTLILQTGPNGGKVNALSLNTSGNAALLGTLTQAGIATPRMQLETAKTTTSGTVVDFTGIPSWAKRITLLLNAVSTSGTSNFLTQIGSGSITTSGYVSGSSTVVSSEVSGSSTAGFILINAGAANTYNGSIVITTIGSNVWIASGVVQFATQGIVSGGSVTLSGTLDRLRLTTVGGTDTFDAGTVNILIEG